jgi:ribosomal protein L33
MNEIYLTEELKKWYMDDFQNLLKIDKEFWEIDNADLKSILIKINQNESIQTIYSKYKNNSNFIDKLSYLKFCYTENIELKLFREIIPFFITKYNGEFEYSPSVCDYDFFLPKTNANFNENSSIHGMNCIDSNDYFKVNHISLNLETEKIDLHKEFWDDLTTKLYELK